MPDVARDQRRMPPPLTPPTGSDPIAAPNENRRSQLLPPPRPRRADAPARPRRLAPPALPPPGPLRRPPHILGPPRADVPRRPARLQQHPRPPRPLRPSQAHRRPRRGALLGRAVPRPLARPAP